jgi:hypothetical protein
LFARFCLFLFDPISSLIPSSLSLSSFLTPPARYAACDVVFLQEVAANFVPKLAASPLGLSHHVCSPAKLDAARDQNSVILLSKQRFAAPGPGTEVGTRCRALVILPVTF